MHFKTFHLSELNIEVVQHNNTFKMLTVTISTVLVLQTMKNIQKFHLNNKTIKF